MAGKSNLVALCDCCSHLVMNTFCWLLWRSQKGVIGLVELWPKNTKPAHQCRGSHALPLANHVSDVVGKKKISLSAAECASYTLNYPMMTLQMQHMPSWPQVPTTVISSASHQSSSAVCSRHGVLGSCCSLKPGHLPSFLYCLYIRDCLIGSWPPKAYANSKFIFLCEWEAWLMFTMWPADIWGILPNALAEVIPKIIIRQFLRAIRGLKWHFP